MNCNAMQSFHSKQSLTGEVTDVFIPRMSSEKLTEQMTFRVSPSLYRAIELIARKQRRKPNEVARALLERGVAAFMRDGVLFEDDPVGEFVEEMIQSARQLAAQGQADEEKRGPRGRAKLVESTADVGRVRESESSKRAATKHGGKAPKK